MSRPNPFRDFRTSPEIIRLAAMMYVRFLFSRRNIVDLLHARDIEVSHETIRCRWNRFGPTFDAAIRRRRIDWVPGWPQWQCHVDEAFVKINGEHCCLRRTRDHEGEVQDAFVSTRRDRKAALKFFRKSMKRSSMPEVIVSDRLNSYGAALRNLGVRGRQRTGLWLNNMPENAHRSFRRHERAMRCFGRLRSLQKFAAVHAAIHNHFNLERHLDGRSNFKRNRADALAEWRRLAPLEVVTLPSPVRDFLALV